MRAATQSPTILMVEDNPDDQDLARLTNARIDSPCRLVFSEDGAHALKYLQECTRPDGPLPPDLLLVDLNMPRMNGLELLKAVRQNERLQRLPVVIFTTSSARGDIDAAYRGGCSSYIIKPFDLKSLRSIFEQISGYWFGCVQLPEPNLR